MMRPTYPLHVLLVALTGWAQREHQHAIEYLIEENRVLRELLDAKRLQLNDDQRRRLATKGKRLGGQMLERVATIVTPDTILRWHRRLIAAKWTYATSTTAQRRRLMSQIKALIIRMATDNPHWGYTRIQGNLRDLGHRVGRTTVARTLKGEGIDPAPDRPSSWRTFLRAHWGQIAAMDFFTTEVWTSKGLTTIYTLFVIDLRTRRVHIAGSTPHPDEAFMLQVARNLTDAVDGFLLPHRHLICDRDAKFTRRFREILGDADVGILLTPYRAPNCNGFAERFVRSIKQECLDRLIFFGVSSLRRAIGEYVEHYHRERPHQGLENIAIERDRLPRPMPLEDGSDQRPRYSKSGTNGRSERRPSDETQRDRSFYLSKIQKPGPIPLEALTEALLSEKLATLDAKKEVTVRCWSQAGFARDHRSQYQRTTEKGGGEHMARALTWEAPDWRSHVMGPASGQDPFVEFESEASEKAAVAGALEYLVEAGILPTPNYNDTAYQAFCSAVRRSFDIPWTGVSPRMRRLIYSINTIVQPQSLVCAGVFCGYTYICNAGASIGPGATYESTIAVGLELIPKEAARAQRNVSALAPDCGNVIVAADASDWLARSTQEIDLLYLDAKSIDFDPAATPVGDRTNESEYLKILRAGRHLLTPNSLLLAHNSQNAAREVADYLRHVRGSDFSVSANIVIDDAGLEVSRPNR